MLDRKLVVSIAASTLFVSIHGSLRADDTKLVTTLDGTTALSGRMVDMTPDGRFVLFTSKDPGLVPNDTNDRADLFVKDRELGAIERVNVGTDGKQDHRTSEEDLVGSSISDDGNLVAFTTAAKLDDADNAGLDVYLRDRAATTTTLVSHSDEGGGAFEASFLPNLSGDGAHIAYTTTRLNDLKYLQVVSWERATDTFSLVSSESDGTPLTFCTNARSSAVGLEVAFTMMTRHGDVSYAKDLVSGVLEKVAIDSTGTADWAYSELADISPDGRFVLFTTAYPLVPEDSNGTNDGYVRDRTLATTERVTFGAGFTELDGWETRATGMSSDARRIAFVTLWNASGDDHNDVIDAFVCDRDTGATLRVSLGPHDEESHESFTTSGQLSADGHLALFETPSPRIWPGDTNNDFDVSVRELRSIPAAWTNYGDGFPGRYGIPTIDLDAPPRRSLTVNLDLGNSSGTYTVCALFIGIASASLPTGFGGTLLVDPLVTVPLALTPWGTSLGVTIPTAGSLPGVHVYLQAVELDPWAEEGVSFTPGLDVTIGD